MRNQETVANSNAALTSKISQIKTALEATEETLSTAKTESVEAKSQHSELERTLETQAAEVRESNNNLDDAIHRSPFDTAQEFQKALLSETDAEALKAEITHWETTLNNLKGAVATLKSSVADSPTPDVEAIEAKLSEKQSSQRSSRLFNKRMTIGAN